jgi:hypothetical protein
VLIPRLWSYFQIGSRVGHLSSSGGVAPGLTEAAKTFIMPDETKVVAIS